MDGGSVDSEMKNADCRKTTLFAEPFKSPANSQTNKENELKHRQTESDTFVRMNRQTDRQTDRQTSRIIKEHFSNCLTNRKRSCFRFQNFSEIEILV
jgi:hypothetical protein